VKASRLATGVFADTSGEGKGNIGAIELNTYTLVVDSTISSKTAKAFRRSLQSQVETPLRKLVLTHYHSDHTLGIPGFKDCEIIAAEPYRKLRRARKYQPTRSFESSLVLRDGDLSVELVRAGGHTDDSTYVYFPQEKTLFSGDLIFARTFFYAGDPTFNPEVWLAALNSFLSMEIDIVVPGHGPVCDKEEVSTYAAFFKEVSATVEKLVADGVKKQEVIEHAGFPEFHNEYRTGLRELALGNWYEFYKRKSHVQKQE
jgi:glyoxylase-like metal-dependent hydrolase (beta-lactamase superfamily II)